MKTKQYREYLIGVCKTNFPKNSKIVKIIKTLQTDEELAEASVIIDGALQVAFQSESENYESEINDEYDENDW
jgi:hypothetical protein